MKTVNTTKFDPACVRAVLRRTLKHEDLIAFYSLAKVKTLTLKRRKLTLEINWKSTENIYVWLPDDANATILAAQFLAAAKFGTSWNYKYPTVRDHAAVITKMAEWVGDMPLHKLPPKPKPTKETKLEQRLKTVKRRLEQWTTAQKAATRELKAANNKLLKYNKEAEKIRRRLGATVS